MIIYCECRNRWFGLVDGNSKVLVLKREITWKYFIGVPLEMYQSYNLFDRVSCWKQGHIDEH